MNKKVIVIAALAAVLVVGGGVIAANTINNAKPSGNTDSTAATVSTTDHIIFTDSDHTEGNVTENIRATDAPTASQTAPIEEQLVSATFTIQYVLDHTTNEEVTPRTVFGASHGDCYAKFGSDQSFEICLDPASGAIRTGTYHIYEKIVSVEYENGTGSEYDIITDESGNITYLIVNYGDYDVYFG